MTEYHLSEVQNYCLPDRDNVLFRWVSGALFACNVLGTVREELGWPTP